MSNANLKLTAPIAPVAGTPGYPSLYRAYLRTYQVYLRCFSDSPRPLDETSPEPSGSEPLVNRTLRHSKSGKPDLKCNVCERVFISRNGLFAHLEEARHYKKKTRVSKKVLNQPRTIIYQSAPSPLGKEEAGNPQIIEVDKRLKEVLTGRPTADGLLDDLSFLFTDKDVVPLYSNPDFDFLHDQALLENEEIARICNKGAVDDNQAPISEVSSSMSPPPQHINKSTHDVVPSSIYIEPEVISRRNRSYSLVTTTRDDDELFSDSSIGNELIYTKTEPFVPDSTPIDMSLFTLSNRIRAVDLTSLPILE